MICQRHRCLGPAIEVLSATLLGAALAAPLGWIVGEMRDHRTPREGMTIGAAAGTALDMIIGVAQVRLDRLRTLRETVGPDTNVADYTDVVAKRPNPLPPPNPGDAD